MTLFHYCSTSTFENIIKNKSIWLSSLSSSNDTQEGKTLSLIVKRFCEDNHLLASQADLIVRQFRMFERQMDCLGMCLSAEEDMLSQWRGYADDAAGMSIGFSDKFFSLITNHETSLFPVRMHQVVYDEDAQEKLLISRFSQIEQIVKNGDLQLPTMLGMSNKYQTHEDALKAHNRAKIALIQEIVELTDLLYATKNPAFKEEKEWRFICETDKAYADCAFRSRGAALVPYLELPFPAIDRPFDLVMIGPKNPTPPAIIAAFLKNNGINCEVRQSLATYR